MSLRADFLRFDDRLGAAGVPPCTAWWRAGIGEWLDAYERGNVLELWVCCGRGGSKSTSLYKLAIFFALFGAFEVPPGEIHYAIVLSRLKEEAAKGVAIIDRWLFLLSIPHHLAGDVIELGHLPRGIRVVAASVAATSGWRCFFIGKDERSKWASSTLATEDAEEVDTSAAAMSATHRNAPLIAFGSAWGDFGAFFDTITTGSDASRVVLGPAATWVVAPHISEEDCRRKERDPKRFAREYKCEFQAGVSSVFDPDDIDKAFLPRDHSQAIHAQRVMILDVSSGKKDAWTFGLCGWNRPKDPKLPAYLAWDLIDGVYGSFFKTINAVDLIARLAKIAREKKAFAVFGDQREEYLARSTFGKLGVQYCPLAWTGPNKQIGVEVLRRWMREGSLALPEHKKLKTELLSFAEVLSPSGNYSYGARQGTFDDHVALLITSVLVNERGFMPSPPRYAAPGTPLLGKPTGFIYEERAQGGVWGPGSDGEGPAVSSAELVNSLPGLFGR